VRRFANRKTCLIGLAVIAVMGLWMFAGRDHTRLPHTFTGIAMDTFVKVDIYSTAGSGEAGLMEEAAGSVLEEFQRLDTRFNRFKPASEISRINASAGEWVATDDEILSVLASAREYTQITGGAFDITVGPLVDLWGFGTENPEVPSPAEIRDVLGLIDGSKMIIDRPNKRVKLTPGMSLDPGGILKGYAVDRAATRLREEGIRTALIDAGGNIYVLGRKERGPWRIGIQHPRSPDNVIAVVSVDENKALATSGDYQRFFEADGHRYHHILDPRTGRPSRHLVSATVIADSAMEADALSTGVFVLGPDKGMDLVERLPGVEAVLVDREMNVVISSGLRGVVRFAG